MNKMKTLFHTSGMRALVAAGALVAGLGFAATASAGLTASVGGVPTGSGLNYESFDSCVLFATPCTPSSLLSVVLTPNAMVVNGSQPGLYAAPYISNSNGSLFGDPTISGQDTTNFLTTGSDGAMAGAAVTLNFTNSQRYLGLLWGSVDAYNTLTFYSGLNGTGGVVDTFAGGQISGVAGTGNCVGGNQGSVGTCYVNINLSSPFMSVIATSSDYAFEFDNVAFSTNTIGVPEPGVVSMFLLGLLLLGSGYWFKKREHRVS